MRGKTRTLGPSGSRAMADARRAASLLIAWLSAPAPTAGWAAERDMSGTADESAIAD
jgi:hypothetical protein